MKAFRAKLRLFESQLRNFNVAHFPTLTEIKCAFPNAKLSAKMGEYVSVITSLMTEFSQRFQDFSVIEKEITLFAAPFSMDAEEVEESLQLELIEVQCDDSLKNQHQLLSLPDFYRSLEKAKFPLMRRHAKRMMSLLGSTYICEQTFSLLTLNKSRLRTRTTDSHRSVTSFASQPPNLLLTCQLSFRPKRSITAPTERNILPITGQ
ncbi:general transcription factor II-I repeat domain-containing protein 2-like [Hippoglossus stenolepis]|uniref:general transcription factor II-I repeat domain-containing protein 2-like n=1 Tax=Hippoglossus stenolepis TaxID=195615 RepID=UPI001FB01FB1|nr:general transcription factor II-I repeat domain-containing protein 2-like [Hippoglossus stenolepis]